MRRKARYLEAINAFAHRLLRVNTVEDAVWAVAKYAVAKLGFVDCIVYLVNEKNNTLYQVAAHGPKNPIAFDINNPITLRVGEGVCGYVARSGVSELIGDTSKDPRYKVDDDMRYSEIAVPIISNKRIIGVIDSEHPDKNFYSEDDVEILETIASMVSVKIDQARSREELQKHKDKLQRMVDEQTAELKNTIAQLEDSNAKIVRSNIEKETLLKEIHHRVKNNLQIVSSLLNLHANQTESEADANVFLDCQSRIKSMSIIHEQLYKKSDLSRIDAKTYVEEIARELVGSFKASDQIKLEFDLKDVYLQIDTSVPFGLILNELIVNALKHAFPDDKGSIRIELSQKDSVCRLTIIDNGQGYDLNATNNTMGLELVDTLVTQLEGSINYESTKNGTRCTLSFPTK